MRLIESFDKKVVDTYIELVVSYYRVHNQTTEIHIDSLLVLYRFTGSDKLFNVIFDTHHGLLIKLTRTICFKYGQYLYDEDYNELLSMCYGEFYRRTLYYSIPPQAPFSKYVKLYLKRWLNTYTKVIVKKNNRIILNCDRELEFD